MRADIRFSHLTLEEISVMFTFQSQFIMYAKPRAAAPPKAGRFQQGSFGQTSAPGRSAASGGFGRSKLRSIRQTDS